MDTLTWRGATAEDEPLLLSLFTASKAPEFAPLGLSPLQLEPLLHMQYRARNISYAQAYPGAMDMILCLGDGTPVGRHLVARQADAYRSTDLAVLPAHRNRGVGTWAIRQVQQIAALEAVPLRLSVSKTNPALKLYQRLGFMALSGDELVFEMEWQPPTQAGRRPFPEEYITLPGEPAVSRQQVLDLIFAFLRGIGLTVEIGIVPSNSFLPGIQLIPNGLRVDLEALLYPGDLLHEAGHLAVMTPERRSASSPTADGIEPGGDEMAALSWSYAAALEAGIPPGVVFHEHGYKGQGQQLLESFRNGNPVGLPLLWWLGLTTQPQPGKPSIYPKMLCWLRGTPSGESDSGESSRQQQLCDASPSSADEVRPEAKV